MNEVASVVYGCVVIQAVKAIITRPSICAYAGVRSDMLPDDSLKNGG
jgi:hypothetical protein